MNKLYYLGNPEDGFGWGIANTNLIQALGKLCQVIIAPRTQKRFDAPIFVPIANPDLSPAVKHIAPRILGYCFAEWPLPEDAERNARIYDTVFAGSVWNCERLIAAGINHCQPLLQGIDHERFCPQPPSERKGFTVFSGGKYEFRKGQDLVIAAMSKFMSKHSDVVLLAAWHNPWKESMESMNNTWLIDPKDPFKTLPRDRVILLPSVPNVQTSGIYAQAHIGLFPNRCEAGTNLVMSEFMACERPVIASFATGHRDVLGETLLTKLDDEFTPERYSFGYTRYPYLLLNGSYDYAGWFNPPVSDIITHLEHAYNHREELQDRATECRELTKKLTWEACAKKIYNAAFEI